MPLHAAAFFNKHELIDTVSGKPGLWDTVVLTFFADGATKTGKRITAAAEIIARGDTVYVPDGTKLQGPPSTLKSRQMYKAFDVDSMSHQYSTDEPAQDGSGKELINKKCASCHEMDEIRHNSYTFGKWREIVNWHMDRNPLWLNVRNRRALVSALAENYSPPAAAAAAEKKVMAQGQALLQKKCFSCHKKEPILDRSRSREGWKNILIRSDYWNIKVSGKTLFDKAGEKEILLSYLDLAAGSEGALPSSQPPDSPMKLFQNICFNCHSTILETYNWKESDREAVTLHLKRKLADSPYLKRIDDILDYLYR